MGSGGLDANFSRFAHASPAVFLNSATRVFTSTMVGGGFYCDTSASYNITGGTTANKNTFNYIAGYFSTEFNNPTLIADTNTKLVLNHYAGKFTGFTKNTCGVQNVFGVWTTATGGTNNYGVWSNAGLNVFAGNTRIGGTTDPTVALDVTGQITSNNIVTGTYFQTSTAITANSSGTVTIVAKDANLLTANAGWMPIKKSDGTTVYIPYWT